MLDFWQRCVAEIWGITAPLGRLDGEYDLNFTAGDHILKVMRPDCPVALVEMQVQALAHLQHKGDDLPVPAVVPTRDGSLMATVTDPEGRPRLVWVLERKPGKAYAMFKPKTDGLIHQVGAAVGAMDAAWRDFDHPALKRDFKWNLVQATWIADELDIISDPSRRSLLTAILEEFRALEPGLKALPSVAIHNDVNDYNLIVDGALDRPPHLTGVIDLGDMCAAPRICDLAITAAYMVLGHPQPEAALVALVEGYHGAYPLTGEELDMLWPLLRMRLAVSVVNSTLMTRETPDDPYVVISQKPAWAFLESGSVNADLLPARLRAACGVPVRDGADAAISWIRSQRGQFALVLGEALDGAPMMSLSVEEATVPQDPFNMTLVEAADMATGDQIMLGHYNEPRLVYTDGAFYNGPWKASNRRTVHLGVDLFAPAGRDVFAPLEGVVAIMENRRGELDYGGMLILRHETPSGEEFHTLYGHLDPSAVDGLKVGSVVAKGQVIARLGQEAVNGGWAPHLHFQLALSIDGLGADWPGVADPDELDLWHGVCPNPAALLNLPDEKVAYRTVSKPDVLAARKERFGRNLKLTYSDPVMFLRGWRHHLFDEWGRPYLDSYNNVPHVGHAHPRIQAVAADQLKRMNSNTRYLHPAQTAFADKILSKMPEHLTVCFFVNSGSEANELALRLARAHTGGKDMITPDHGYHGNTTGCIDISAYKFNAPGGVGPSDWVHLVDVADEYRGRFRRDDPERAEKYAALIGDALDRITARGGKLAGFIAETFPSVGGQIIPPEGYLTKVYDRIRAAGGVCIADEVQAGLGRLGDYYFGFEQQDAAPDMVVLGKPIGNGHPLGVLVTTREIADSFAQGPEYFSTFGGSTLSCRMGREVLQIVDDEGLMENARTQGGRLLSGLRALQDRYRIVGDVRGFGLFIGLELVTDRDSLTPGTALAAYVKNRMRAHRILMGSEGPADNILKIRPPLTIEAEDVAMILTVMDQVLDEAQSLLDM